jgi:hypothetical protein
VNARDILTEHIANCKCFFTFFSLFTFFTKRELEVVTQKYIFTKENRNQAGFFSPAYY